jgi:hypothetical protein
MPFDRQLRNGSTPAATISALWSLSDEDLPVALLFVALAAVACVIPAQADTFYHLRAGQTMWDSGWLLEREAFSHVTYGQPHPNHWWLAQLAFFGLYSLGGPLLLTVVGGACALVALIGSWLLTRGTSADLRLILLLVLMLGLPEWSVRPQVFSLALMLLTVRLILADRLMWVPLVILVWANIHAVVVLGVALVLVVLLESVVWSRDLLSRVMATAVASVVAPMISPLGVHFWPYSLKVVREARLLGIAEYRSAFRVTFESVGLWAVIGVLLLLTFRAAPTLANRDRRDRMLLLASGVLAAAAVMSMRNTAFFVLVAAPTIACLARLKATRRPKPAGPIAVGLVGGLAVLAVAWVSYRWQREGADLGWKPLTPAAIQAVRDCPSPMYNGFYDGGALIWFIPQQRVFVDGRTDAYPIEFLLRVSRAELQGDYRALFADYHIKCAVVRGGSPMARALTLDSSMALQFADAKWSVFRVNKQSR